MAPPPPNAATANAVRHLGRFQLLRLLGKSQRTMLWLVAEARGGTELMLALPRAQPPDAAGLQRWLAAARKAARVDHPGLARVVEVGEHDRWPYIAYERANQVTLSERIGRHGVPPAELVPWALPVLEGLAFAHEAGMAHHDVQPGMLVLGESGQCRLLGLGVALPPPDEANGLQGQRRAAERDVLCLGLVLHHALVGSPALDQADVGMVVDRLPPLGREQVRLPFTSAHSVPEALRAIVNRATDRQERQRYRNARTFERALAGWLKAEGEPGGGPMLLLQDRMRAAGLLPAMPGGPVRAARLALMEREHVQQIADSALQDIGLAFELLRNVNGVRMRGTVAGGNGPILTLRRAIAMIGLDGLRRAAAALRPWPGPLSEPHAAELAALIQRVQLAGKVAQWLRPPGYDPELVFLLALLQCLGRLVVQYHFPEEAAQVRRLMLPAPPAQPGEPDEPGMSEEGASFAVLGVDLDALGVAVGRHWGLDEGVLLMIRRTPLATAVLHADNDGDMLRLTASCANEVVDCRAVPAAHRPSALQRVVHRYGRVLGLSLRDVQLAAQGVSPDQDTDVDAAVAATAEPATAAPAGSAPGGAAAWLQEAGAKVEAH